MARRTRLLNVSTQTVVNTRPAILPLTGSWDLETDWEPPSIKRTMAHLRFSMQFYAFDVPDDVLTDVLLAELTDASIDPLTTD